MRDVADFFREAIEIVRRSRQFGRRVGERSQSTRDSADQFLRGAIGLVESHESFRGRGSKFLRARQPSRVAVQFLVLAGARFGGPQFLAFKFKQGTFALSPFDRFDQCQFAATKRLMSFPRGR